MSRPRLKNDSHKDETTAWGSNHSPRAAHVASWIVCFLVLTTCVAIFAVAFQNSLGASAYMDEIFHLPQAREYCAHGNWTHWDPKITTLPGLYGLATVFSRGAALIGQPILTYLEALPLPERSAGKIINVLLGGAQSVLKSQSHVLNLMCTNAVLRFTVNPICALLSAYVVHRLLALYNPNSSFITHTLSVLVIATFPLSFFFNFLFYTDTGSLLFVLLTLWATETGRVRLGAVPAAIAILFRQTNVVWVAFIAVHYLITRIYGPYTTRNGASSALNPAADPQVNESLLVDDAIEIGTGAIPTILSYSARNLLTLVSQFFFHAILLVAFAVFVVWNGGITVGDREAHKPVLHFPQVLYFVAFTGIFGAPMLIFAEGILLKSVFGFLSSMRRCLTNPTKQGSVVVLALAAVFYAVKKYTMAHPYLLADNRHYTFYIWRRSFMEYEMFKYAMIPVYFCIFGVLARQLKKALKIRLPRANNGALALWILAFFAFTAATLIPSPLLEFRYFIIPFVLVSLMLFGHGNISSVALVLQLALNIAINLATIFLFLYLPIPTGNAAEPLLRFIW